MHTATCANFANFADSCCTDFEKSYVRLVIMTDNYYFTCAIFLSPHTHTRHPTFCERNYKINRNPCEFRRDPLYRRSGAAQKFEKSQMAARIIYAQAGQHPGHAPHKNVQAEQSSGGKASARQGKSEEEKNGGLVLRLGERRGAAQSRPVRPQILRLPGLLAGARGHPEKNRPG